MIGLPGYFHMVLFGLLLPAVAVRRARMPDGMQYPPRRKLFLSVLVQHTAFIGLSLLVAWAERIELFALSAQPAKSWGVTGAMVAAMIAVMMPRWKRNVINRERKVYLFMPHGPSEKGMWTVISALAGFGEELIYRGVLWELLTRLTGSLWLAALLAAIAFALGHSYQGWESLLVIFVFSLLFHALVWWTGSLIPAMTAHFLYDLTAGMTYSHFGEKYGYPFKILPAR
ncbi:MAG: CPBP family intramembrane glutamic endopeptidase [Burkholderiales bacterium]